MEKKSRLLRLIIEDREDVITWNDSISSDVVLEVLVYIKDLLRKKYSTDSFNYRDYENQHYELDGILKFEVTPVFITIPHRTNVKTFQKVDPRPIKNLYAIKENETVKITKFENSKRIDEIEMKYSAIKVLNNKHKDMEFEDPLLNETKAYDQIADKLSNINITVKNPVESTKLTNPYQFVQVKKEDDSPDFKKTNNISSSNTQKETSKQDLPKTTTQKQEQPTKTTTSTNQSSISTSSSKSQSDFEKINSMNKNPMGKKVELQNYTLADVAKHSSLDDCWMVINGKVYDITKYIPYHPGGKKIMEAAGKDGTSLFSKILKINYPR